MYDLTTMRSIQRWENEGGKLLPTSRIPAVTKEKRDRKPSSRLGTGPRCSGQVAAGRKTVVVPIDLSATCTDGLDYAVSYARNLGFSILVLHVIPRFRGEGLIESHDTKALRVRATNLAARKIKRLVASKASSNVPITFEVRRGFPEYQIIKAAEDANAEMIIIARRNRGLLRRMLFGSVTEDLLAASRIPVMVITQRC